MIELLETIVTAGKPTAANRVHALVSKIFSFAINADLLTVHPATRLDKRGSEKKGRRVLSDDEFGCSGAAQCSRQCPGASVWLCGLRY